MVNIADILEQLQTFRMNLFLPPQNSSDNEPQQIIDVSEEFFFLHVSRACSKNHRRFGGILLLFLKVSRSEVIQSTDIRRNLLSSPPPPTSHTPDIIKITGVSKVPYTSFSIFSDTQVIQFTDVSENLIYFP
jgi:hypothetical protein